MSTMMKGTAGIADYHVVGEVGASAIGTKNLGNGKVRLRLQTALNLPVLTIAAGWTQPSPSNTRYSTIIPEALVPAKVAFVTAVLLNTGSTTQAVSAAVAPAPVVAAAPPPPPPPPAPKFNNFGKIDGTSTKQSYDVVANLKGGLVAVKPEGGSFRIRVVPVANLGPLNLSGWNQPTGSNNRYSTVAGSSSVVSRVADAVTALNSVSKLAA